MLYIILLDIHEIREDAGKKRLEARRTKHSPQREIALVISGNIAPISWQNM